MRAADHPRRRKTLDGVVRLLAQVTPLHQGLAYGSRFRPRRIEYHADQQAPAAHLAYRPTAQAAQLPEKLGPEFAGTTAIVILDLHIDSLQPDGGGERIAAAGAAVVARMKDLHELT